MIRSSLVLILILGNSFLVYSQTGCSIVIPNLDPEPIVVTTNGYQFLYPAPNTTSVSIPIGENVIISCPGGRLSVGTTSFGTTITATCVSGTTFIANNLSIIDFNQIVCSKNPSHTARYTGKSCESGGREIEIGFVLTNTSFAREMRICFDVGQKNALYSEYNLTKSIGEQETDVSRPSFVEDSFYGLGAKLNDLYTRALQRTTINNLVGLPANSTKYIEETSDYYLARGHLTAKADYVYDPQQQGTFHYCNAAPQWQTFNGDNWNILEGNVRDYADAKGLDLKVYTGTYGVTTLPHEQTGKDVPIYLYVDSNGNTALPVPELYWKVVHDPKAKLGVALLGINNPYQQNVSKSIICTDVSSKIGWLTWKATNLKSGYGYACQVDELRQKVPYLPKFETTGLLL